ncbi:MAG: hypothetical protein HY673_09020 [Chloroflexi bacterium]|nr:hypothetical protein [Chloroflexota bacterium]
MKRNPYLRLGTVLAVSGAMAAPVFYFIVASAPLTALAISAIMLGLISAMLGNARPDVSPEASRMMLRTGMENTAALLEELGLRSRAVYLPSSPNGHNPKAFIPLSENGTAPAKWQSVPGRLLARYGPKPEDMGLVVTTPGSVSLDGISVVKGGGPGQMEAALNNILVGMMDLADSVSVHYLVERVLVQVTNPRMKYENIWFYRCLGSPLASIAATVVSQSLEQPVRVASETEKDKKMVIEIEVLR